MRSTGGCKARLPVERPSGRCRTTDAHHRSAWVPAFAGITARGATPRLTFIAPPPKPCHPRECEDPTVTADQAWVPACAGMTVPSAAPRPLFVPSSRKSRHPRECEDPTLTADQAWVPACAGMTARGATPRLTFIAPPPKAPSSSRMRGPSRHRRSSMGPRLRGDDGSFDDDRLRHPGARSRPAAFAPRIAGFASPGRSPCASSSPAPPASSVPDSPSA
jgi:hypothetical protein